jgi:hypothetical protein
MHNGPALSLQTVGRIFQPLTVNGKIRRELPDFPWHKVRFKTAVLFENKIRNHFNRLRQSFAFWEILN